MDPMVAIRWLIILFISSIATKSIRGELFLEDESYQPCFDPALCDFDPCYDFNAYKSLLSGERSSFHQSESELPFLSSHISLPHNHLFTCDNFENQRCNLSAQRLLRNISEIHDIISLNSHQHLKIANAYLTYNRTDNTHEDMEAHLNASVTWDKIVLYLPIAKDLFRMNVQYYWLDILVDVAHSMDISSKPFIINYILIAEDDSPMTLELLKPYFHKYDKFLNMSMVRVPHHTAGYDNLLCKMTAGMKLIYDMFPDKLFYIKIDDDTAIFPHRLLKMLRTMHLFYKIEDQPIYLGTKYQVCHNGVGVETLTNIFVHTNEDQGKPVIPSNTTTNVCFAQGGAGYVLNNVAMRLFLQSPSCTDSEKRSFFNFSDPLGEDQYIGLYLYARYRTRIIHCGSFHSNGHTTGQYQSENMTTEYSYFEHAISFHRVSPTWIYKNPLKDLKEHYESIARR